MTPRGRRPFGDGPGDAEEPGHDNGEPGGWIPPEDRVWRHPSEMTGPNEPAEGVPAPPLDGSWGPRRPPNRSPGRRSFTTIVIGIGAAAAVVTGIVLLVNTAVGQAPDAPLTTGQPPLLTASKACCRTVPLSASSAQRSLLSLRISSPGGLREACAVAFAPGGLVLTTADAVAGSSSIEAMGSRGGWTKAAVVASDPTADVAVVRVDASVPAAPFGDDGALNTTGPTIVMADAPRRGASSAATIWGPSEVETVAGAVPAGNARGLAAVTTGRSDIPALAGEVLVDQSGSVVGLLDAGAATANREVFLPGRFALDVAEQLATVGRIRHGWLDVALADAGSGNTITTTAAPLRPTAGAEVVSVMSNGAAAGVLNPGDLIVGVDGQPVRSMAELRSRLYVIPAGRWVNLAIWRASTPVSVDVNLAASP